MNTELIQSLVSLTVAILSIGIAYYQTRKVELKQRIINAVFKAAEKLIIAGKDFKVTEDEWQDIADDVTKELNTIIETK